MTDFSQILILGGGGHSKVLISAILSTHRFKILGILDPQLSVGQKVRDQPVLGDDTLLLSENYQKTPVVIGVGFVNSYVPRQKLFEKIKGLKREMPKIIHAQALVDEYVEIEEGAQIFAGAIIQPDCKISSNVIINTGAIIEHDCQIGAHAHIAPGAVLGGGVKIGRGSLVGIGSRVLPGVTIGSEVIVGAGAVVTRHLSDGVIATGIPAKTP